MLYRAWLAVLGVILCAGSAWSEDPFLRDPDQRLWNPVADDVYLQELGSQIQTDRPILSVADYDGTLYALTDQGGYRLDGKHLERVPELPAGLQRLRVLDDALWAMGSVGQSRAGDRLPIDQHHLPPRRRDSSATAARTDGAADSDCCLQRVHPSPDLG